MTTPTDAIAIAPLRWWRLEEVHELERGLFPVDSWSLEQFWQELAQPTRRYLVAVEDGEVIGYAGLSVMPPDADVQTIAVRPDRQGRGIAARLLTAQIDEAARAGATHLLLEVRADNVAARSLYERFGFVRISERRRYYADGTDAVIMRLALTGRVAG
jgi:[ribosomal protein S18]-alanine N-acetyltransferase